MRTKRLRHPLPITAAAGLALAGLFSAGCAANSSRLNSLSPGMSKDEVLATLGRPHATSAQGGMEFLTYNLLGKGSGERREYAVKLVNGRVEAFGEREDFGPNRLVPEPVKPAAK